MKNKPGFGSFSDDWAIEEEEEFSGPCLQNCIRKITCLKCGALLNFSVVEIESNLGDVMDIAIEPCKNCIRRL